MVMVLRVADVGAKMRGSVCGGGAEGGCKCGCRFLSC